MKNFKNGKALLIFGVIFTLILGSFLLGCGNQEKPADAEKPAEQADKFPERGITFLVGFNPGGGMDTMARALAPGMQEKLGVPVTVQNMPGANGAVAAEYLLKQPADGYMVFSMSGATVTYPAMATANITYKDLSLIGIPMGTTPAITVPKDSPIKDMNDLIEALKSKETTASNSGIGGIWHVPQAVMVNEVGGKTEYVPYPGGKPAALAVAKGEVDWGMTDILEAAEFIKDGLSRPLAVFDDKAVNLEGYGEVPPITDAIPSLKEKLMASKGWRSIAYKKGVPENRVKILTEAVKYATTTKTFLDVAEKSNIPLTDFWGAEADKVFETGTRVQSWLLYDIGSAKQSPEEYGIPKP